MNRKIPSHYYHFLNHEFQFQFPITFVKSKYSITITITITTSIKVWTNSFSHSSPTVSWDWWEKMGRRERAVENCRKAIRWEAVISVKISQNQPITGSSVSNPSYCVILFNSSTFTSPAPTTISIKSFPVRDEWKIWSTTSTSPCRKGATTRSNSAKRMCTHHSTYCMRWGNVTGVKEEWWGW